MKRYVGLLLIVTAAIMGFLGGTAAVAVGGTAGTNENIYACVAKANGTIRIVETAGLCRSGEVPLNWSNYGLAGLGGIRRDLAGWNSGSVELGGIVNFNWHDLRGYNFSGIRLIGCQMMYADLTSVNFSHAHIHGCTMDSSIFRGGNLDGAVFIESGLSYSDLTDASLVGLVASYGGFSFSDLTRADLRNATLTGTYFEASNLREADFSGADLSGALFWEATNMDTAILSGVTWNNTRCPDRTNSDDNGGTCLGHLQPLSNP